jgi:predicted Zn-dependent protease
MTVSLLAQLQDDHEIAAVLSHEAAHHVGAHVARMNNRASSDAFLPSVGVAQDGRFSAGQRTDYSAGSARRARARALELEADWIGAFIADRSGYDPEKGAGIFRRAAAKRMKPGSGPSSSHPHPVRRLEVVAAAGAEIRRQRAAGLTPRLETSPARMP